MADRGGLAERHGADDSDGMELLPRQSRRDSQLGDAPVGRGFLRRLFRGGSFSRFVTPPVFGAFFVGPRRPFFPPGAGGGGWGGGVLFGLGGVTGSPRRP